MWLEEVSHPILLKYWIIIQQVIVVRVLFFKSNFIWVPPIYFQTHGNYLVKAHGKLWLLDSWHLFISCYKPMKCMDIICITTSIIYAFDTHGKHPNPQDHHLSYDAIIGNQEHYCNMEFIKVNIIYKSIWNLSYCFKHYN